MTGERIIGRALGTGVAGYRRGNRVGAGFAARAAAGRPTGSAGISAFIAVPVYAGRVAPIALQRIRRLKGENAPVVLVAVYGNRDYEDALVELRDETTCLGFTPLAAGAFIGEHSYSRPGMPVAEGRPDANDLKRRKTQPCGTWLH